MGKMWLPAELFIIVNSDDNDDDDDDNHNDDDGDHNVLHLFHVKNSFLGS